MSKTDTRSGFVSL